MATLLLSSIIDPRSSSKSGAYGIRTRVPDVRGQCPGPLDECAIRKAFQIFNYAGEQGFEPRFYGPEPYVLPLDDSPKIILRL